MTAFKPFLNGMKNGDIDGTCKWTLRTRLHAPVLFCGRYWLMMSCISSASGASPPPPPPGGATIVALFPCDVLDLRSSDARDGFAPLDFLQVKHILRNDRLSCINFHVLNHIMAHSHCRRLWYLSCTKIGRKDLSPSLCNVNMFCTVQCRNRVWNPNPSA